MPLRSFIHELEEWDQLIKNSEIEAANWMQKIRKYDGNMCEELVLQIDGRKTEEVDPIPAWKLSALYDFLIIL